MGHFVVHLCAGEAFKGFSGNKCPAPAARWVAAHQGKYCLVALSLGGARNLGDEN